MLAFMEENRLDIAACGMEVLDEGTGRLIWNRAPEAPLLLTCPEDFSAQFPQYYQFMRSLWGKLFSGRVARHIYTVGTQPGDWRSIRYGSDTLWAFSALRRAERVGISPEILHHYYLSPSSVSYQYDARRFDSDVYRYDDAMDFLAAYGPVSERNRLFLAGM